MRHFLEVDDLTPGELADVIELAQRPDPPRVLAGRGAALLFEKPSARTRNSTEMAVVQLGGHPVTIRGEEVGLDVRETAEDILRTLACYHAVVAARVFEHQKLERMASVERVPVINMLSDRSHPMQAVADLLTIKQHFGELKGRTVAYVGDGNNVARSLMLGAALSGMSFRIASPSGYGLAEADIDAARHLGGAVVPVAGSVEAVEGADVVYTDVWASMGQETEADARRQAFAGYTVDQALMDTAGRDAVLLHCLPAHRGDEVTADVIDGPRSLVWQQAENRMHAARAVLLWVLG